MIDKNNPNRKTIGEIILNQSKERFMRATTIKFDPLDGSDV